MLSKKGKMVRYISRVLILVMCVLISGLGMATVTQAASVTIVNGARFNDISGSPINAHGGDIIKVGSYYYWFGENRSNTDNTFYAVSCYKSTDLKNWEFSNNVLTQSSDPELASCKIERPKVIYNASTGKFVMWMHKELASDYTQARAAVAYCDTVDGNYTYQGSFMPLNYMSRDCTLFQDDDGSAYFISAANNNADLHIYSLTPDYLNVSARVNLLYAGQSREAPCMFKRNGYYFLVTSGCTGWTPNQAKYSYATSIGGTWSALTSFGDSTTFSTQGAYILPVTGTSGTSYLYMGDRWASTWGGKVNQSGYVWLPIEFSSNTAMSLNDFDAISVDTTTGTITGAGYDIGAKASITGSTAGAEESGNPKGNSYDANTSTRWSNTGSLSTAWIEYDLGSTKTVNALKLLPYNSATRVYPLKVEVGDSDASLVEVWNYGTAFKSKSQLIDIPDTSGRYVKITLTANNSDASAYLSLYETEIYVGGVTPSTIVNESFNSMTTGSAPSGWNVSAPSGTTCTVVEVPSATDKSLKLYDNTTSNYTSAEKTFTAQSGIVTVQLKFNIGTIGQWDRIKLNSGTSTTAVDIANIDNFNNSVDYNALGYMVGTSRYKISNISAGTWTTLTIVANTDMDTFDVYVNGELKRAGCSFSTAVTSIDRVTFTTGNSYTDTCYFDNVQVTK